MGALDNLQLGGGTPNTPDNTPSADYTVAPAYQVAADAHNVGNSNFSITDPSSWVDTAQEIPSDVVKFTVGSVVSGLTSIYNSGVKVSNWLGSDADQANVKDVLNSLDSNLGDYYAQHTQGEDLVGFIATSLIPGEAGIKVFNAGQKILGASEAVGVGANIGRAVGLLPDAASNFAKASAADIASSAAQTVSLNQNTIKALAAGVGQNALEGAAFTTAVQATMFQSPILQDEDGSDIVKNILVGGALQGVIGGAFSAAKTFGIIKRGVTAADEVLQPSVFINELPSTATAADRISQRLQDLADTPTYKDLDDFSQNYLNQFPNASDLDAQGLFNRFQSNVENKTTRLNNFIQQDLNEITKGDADLTQQTANTLSIIDPEQAQGNVEKLIEAGRVNTPLKTEAQILAKATGKGFLEDLDPNAPVAAGDKAIQYVKLSGDDAGTMTNLRPTDDMLNLADKNFSAAEVQAKVDSYRFRQDDGWSLAAAKSADQTEARYIWAAKQTLKPNAVIKSDDIPLLERAYEQKIPVSIKDEAGNVQQILPNEMLQHLQNVKNDAAADMLAAGKTTDAIARATNVSRDSLEHSKSADPLRDLFARQTAAQDYTKKLIQNGLWDSSKGLYPLDTKPSWMKVAYNTKAVKDVDGNIVKGMGRITAMQKIAQQGYDNVFAKAVGDENLAARFIPIPKSVLLKANRYGSGPGFFKFANGAYGSLSSLVETIGKAVSDLQRSFKSAARVELEGPLFKLGTKPEAAIEFSALNEEMAATTEKYVMSQDANGVPQLMARSWKRYQDALQAGKQAEAPQIQQGARVIIPIKHPETVDAINAHIRVNGERLSTFKEIRAAQGLEDSKDAETFYPIKPDPGQYPHFAFVVDPTVTGAGHIKMIHAQDAGTLNSLIDKVTAPYRVITKAQSEEFHKTIDDYQWDRTLHENYIDSEIQSKGINSQFFPQTDPQKIVNKILNFHMRGQDVLARELTNMKYSTEFAELRRLGDQFASDNLSKYGNSYKFAEDVAKNPYVDYIKTALNISRANEFPLWQGLNTALDKNVSRIWNTIGDAFTSAKSADDLDAVNSALKDAGLKSAYYDAAMHSLVNQSPNSGVLRGFIQKANALLATLTLRLDPLNSINYAVGHQVLNGAETMSLMRAIRDGNANVAGDLAKLKDVTLPAPAKGVITSPSKLLGNVLRDFVSEQTAKDGSKPLTDYFKANGWIKGDVEAFRSMLDDLSIQGNETGLQLNKRISSAFQKAKDLASKGAVLSGSKLSEEFQGFAAAHVMKQLTDVAVNAGVIDKPTATAYINTFVNRVRGNLLASQRPVMFQGPIGQAVGLFQTYQFNIMQQLLRHVSEGTMKDVATMLGLQGTIYGMQSLPAFNFINQHIVGTASGNPMHRDLYDATYGVLGKTAADWLMYGIPSNLLRTNLYSRGDLNPRNITVIPTSLSDIPIVSSYGRFFQNLAQTANNIDKGGNVWESLLQGIEHNAVSRPLAGLAQTLQAFTDGGYAYSTTAKGNIMGANDLASIATLARLSGGRPLDEALINDATYRVATYQAADMQKRQELGSAMKTTMMAGNLPDQEQVSNFAKEYAASGGTQTNFSKYMLNTMLRANVSQANRLAMNLNSPYSQSMQRVMGGGYALDGSRIDPVTGMSYNQENPTLGVSQ